MTRRAENILRALPGEERGKFLCSNGKPVLQVLNGKVYDLDGQPATTILSVPDPSARSAVFEVGLDCADCDDREETLRDMKLSTM